MSQNDPAEGKAEWLDRGIVRKFRATRQVRSGPQVVGFQSVQGRVMQTAPLIHKVRGLQVDKALQRLEQQGWTVEEAGVDY